MKKNMPIFLLAIGLVACGATPAQTPDNTKSQMVDLLPTTPPADLAMSVADLSGPTLQCGSMTCSSGQLCCLSKSGQTTCAASCGDMGAPVECRDPSYCGGMPCCLTLQSGAPTGILCGSSADACAPNISGLSASTISGQTRLCRNSADCTSGLSQAGTFPDCCVASMQGQSQQICFNKTFAALSGGAITCP
jgi:hypothetical protein